jgi:hypothetical protein
MRSEQRKLQPRTDAAEAERTLPAARLACLVAAIDGNTPPSPAPSATFPRGGGISAFARPHQYAEQGLSHFVGFYGGGLCLNESANHGLDSVHTSMICRGMPAAARRPARLSPVHRRRRFASAPTVCVGPDRCARASGPRGPDEGKPNKTTTAREPHERIARHEGAAQRTKIPNTKGPPNEPHKQTGRQADHTNHKFGRADHKFHNRHNPQPSNTQDVCLWHLGT